MNGYKKNNTNFQHFIITRFNLKNEEWFSDKNGANVLGKDWMSFRYDLFVKTCYNSIKHQTCQNFKWLVYFDIDTNLCYKDRNKKLQKDFENFIPMYKESNNAFLKSISKDIISFTSKNIDYIVTTRIDNDDAFHKDAIKTIQNKVKPLHKFVIDLSYIYCLDIYNKSMTKFNFKSNPFVSIVEQKEKLKTIFSENHNKWRNDKNCEFLQVKDRVYCLQIIHERNVLNTAQGVKYYDTNIESDFNILIPVKFSTLCRFKALINQELLRFKSVLKKL